ncbi:MAG TPA: hypothetical protein VEQ87_07355 [Burkholderiales bacterium]|nr:hypothetical protein [Burkholderiales bacterium]
MRDKAAPAAEQAAPIIRALVMLCFSGCASVALAQFADPMAPPGVAPAGGTDSSVSRGTPTELQGIISGPGRRLALINGSVVQVGETIPGNGELLSVDADSAVVRSGEQRILLRLHPELRKKGATP